MGVCSHGFVALFVIVGVLVFLFYFILFYFMFYVKKKKKERKEQRDIKYNEKIHLPLFLMVKREWWVTGVTSGGLNDNF